MGVDVVAAVLGVVFEDEDGGVIPVGAVRDGVDYAAQGQIVVGDRGLGARAIRSRAAGVIVGEIEQHECGELELGVFFRFAGVNVGGEFVEEFVGAKLVGIVGVEIGIERVEVIAQHGFRRLHVFE